MVELFIAVLVLGVFLVTMLGVFALVATLHLTSKRENGWLHWGYYLTLLATAIGQVLAGRNYSTGFMGQADASIAGTVIKLSSITFVLFASERVVSSWLKMSNGPRLGGPAMLLPSFILFWFGTVASPSFFGAYPIFKHESLYTLVIGWACIVSTPMDADRALKACRNAMLLFNVAGLVMAVVQPNSVMDSQYVAFIPGLPRLAGLAPHALSLGIIVQVTMFCLWSEPLKKPWLNRLAWASCLVSLVMAQSKTAWISFTLCALILVFFRYRKIVSQALFNPIRPALGLSLLVSAILAVSGAILALLFSDLNRSLNYFLASSEGAELTSLTGRYQIWEVAFEEWARHPLFGYGLPMFDESYRAQVGISSATHGHNQFVDTLARAGTVGAVTLVFYVSVLMFWSFRYTNQTKGLSLLLFVALFLRGISEVPLSMVGYGFEFLGHILLLTILASASRRISEKQVTIVYDPLQLKIHGR